MATTTEVEETNSVGSTLAEEIAGKYLTFSLGKESYGVAVIKVREIIRMQEITNVPQMPAFVRGVINLRGKVIPVIDLGSKFGLPSTETTERTCIIVVQIRLKNGEERQMGLIVDAVEEVMNIVADQIEGTPDFGSAICVNYILGMAKVKESVKTLLDIDRVIGADSF